MIEKFTWEKVEANTFRAKVWRGWLIQTRAGFQNAYGEIMAASSTSSFILDETHQWELEPYSKDDEVEE